MILSMPSRDIWTPYSAARNWLAGKIKWRKGLVFSTAEQTQNTAGQRQLSSTGKRILNDGSSCATCFCTKTGGGTYSFGSKILVTLSSWTVNKTLGTCILCAAASCNLTRSIKIDNFSVNGTFCLPLTSKTINLCTYSLSVPDSSKFSLENWQESLNCGSPCSLDPVVHTTATGFELIVQITPSNSFFGGIPTLDFNLFLGSILNIVNTSPIMMTCGDTGESFAISGSDTCFTSPLVTYGGNVDLAFNSTC